MNALARLVAVGLLATCALGTPACVVAEGTETPNEESATAAPDPVGEFPDEQAGPQNQSWVDQTDGPVSEDLGDREAEATCNQCSNCVLYARCRMPRLPYGLTSYSDKVRQINRWSPRAGCVAVIYTGSYYGHVAYVTSVSGSTINIAEGNWPSGHCGHRSGTQSGLRIKGYICR